MQNFPEEYIDGYVIFMGQKFKVDPRALIPRFETEELVKYCVELLKENPEIGTVADIGTGSGIIPISLLSKTGRTLEVFATDMSRDALELARENCEKLCKETPFLKGDVRTSGQGDLLGKNPSPVWNFTEIPYRPDLNEKAKDLRKNMTGPEKKMWYTGLKNDTFKGFRFLRQKPLLNYIVDFYCHELGLVIELDGFSHHGNEEYDQKRTEDLEKHGLTVVRFSNDEVLFSFDDVCDRLAKIVTPLSNKSSTLNDSYKINPPPSSPHCSDEGTSFKKEVFEPITFLRGDLLKPLIKKLGKNVPDKILITANLPYVREKEIHSDLIHEPRMAFLGGIETGFELYERFFTQLLTWKKRPKTCHVVIEFGLWQRDIAETVFQKHGLQYSFFADLRGIERFGVVVLD